MATIRCAKCGTVLTPKQAGNPCPVCASMDRDISDREQAIFNDKAEVARELAKKHYEVEAGLTHVFRITGKAGVEDSPGEPIKLLEVNENTAPSGVMPLHFGPAPAAGIPYPSIIVEVTPDEFKRLKTRQLALPNGWEIGEELPKPSNGPGGA